MVYFLLIYYVSLFQEKSITVYVRDTKSSNFNVKLGTTIVNLYNKRNPDKLNVKFKKISSFANSFDLFRKEKGNDSILYINSLTITDERKKEFDFSIGYFPVRAAIITLNDSPLNNNNIFQNKLIFGVIKKTSFNIDFVKQFADKKNHNIKMFNDIFALHKALKSKQIDYYIGDALEAWYFKNRKLIEILYDAPFQKYGILYPKGSKLKKKLDPIIKYLIHSPNFFTMVKKSFPSLEAKYFNLVRN